MADQEFLASFGVDIDGSGVSRLQKILGEVAWAPEGFFRGSGPNAPPAGANISP